MADNILMPVKQKISAATSLDKVEKILNETFDGVDKIYSYIVYAEYDNNQIVNYIIQYNLSQREEYNTLTPDVVIPDVLCIIQGSKLKEGKKVIGYGQPTLEIILQTYDPLVHKLAKHLGDRWKSYEHEDLCQICRLVMVKLYRKGYYIHRRLLQRSFENEIWMEVKKHRGEQQTVSFEDTFYAPVSSDSEKLLVADTVPDLSIVEEELRKDEEVVNTLIFNEVKDIIIDLIGVRQWNELMRDYGNKHTTAWSRKLLQKIKNYFASLGISRKDFNNKYYG